MSDAEKKLERAAGVLSFVWSAVDKLRAVRAERAERRRRADFDAAMARLKIAIESAEAHVPEDLDHALRLWKSYRP